MKATLSRTNAYSIVLLLISILPAAAQSRQFFDSAGQPVSRGQLVFYRLGASRKVHLDKSGSASVKLDFRERLIVLKDRKGRPLATYSVIWTGAHYRLSASCAGLSCLPDQQVDYFPIDWSASKP